MTEDEAKQKWCPMWRVGNSPDSGGYAAINNHAATRCIGSDCMMFRIIPAHGTIDGRRKEDAANNIKVYRAAIPGDGYCGLGGKP